MRKQYIDNIRWITVMIVVVYHVIYMFNGVQLFGVIGPFKEYQIQDAFQYLVYPWFMALLFVVSGMSTKFYLDHHTIKELVKDKTRKLLVPSTIGLFVFQWIMGYFNIAISGGLDVIYTLPKPLIYVIMAISGTGVLWYIQMLWIFSMLLLLVCKIDKNRLLTIGEKTPVWLLLLLTIIYYGMAQIGNLPITVYRFGIYGFCFFIGYFIFSHDVVIERLSKYWLYLDIVAIALGISYTLRYFGLDYATSPVLNNVHACVFSWIAILAIFATMNKYGNFSNSITKFMRKEAWGIYIFHYLTLAMTAYSLKLYVPNMKPVFVYVICFIASFVGAILLNEIVSRIPILRWCVLGIKKEKKDV